jgi:hypothetical protein
MPKLLVYHCIMMCKLLQPLIEDRLEAKWKDFLSCYQTWKYGDRSIQLHVFFSRFPPTLDIFHQTVMDPCHLCTTQVCCMKTR